MRILLFSDLALPASCANATRVVNFAKLLCEAGHDVKLLGVCYDPKAPLGGVCDGLSYEMLRAAPFFGLRAGKRVARLKKDIAAFLGHQPAYEAILLSNVYFDYAHVFMKYANPLGKSISYSIFTISFHLTKPSL